MTTEETALQFQTVKNTVEGQRLLSDILETVAPVRLSVASRLQRNFPGYSLADCAALVDWVTITAATTFKGGSFWDCWEKTLATFSHCSIPEVI